MLNKGGKQKEEMEKKCYRSYSTRTKVFVHDLGKPKIKNLTHERY